MNLKEGTFLQGDKYKITRYISSGGFGCTYEAEHVMLKKRVAIKEFFVKDFCNRDETTAHISVGTSSKKGLVEKLKKKFIDEARAISILEHPNIVSVTDVFEENGTAYYVMDYVDGESLADKVKESGPMLEKEAIEYIRQIAKALEYVHDNNRLHLDIKPANIMVDKRDNAILIDFGASKQYDEEDGENTSTLVGKTPGYAPLEQIGNDVVKFLPATDIYALGATLYKLLTGITPLSANQLGSGEKLDPLPKGTSENVRKLIEASMKIKKTERPQSIREFLSILDANEELTIIDIQPPTNESNPGQEENSQTTNKGDGPRPVDSPKGIKKILVITLLVVFFVVVIIIGINVKSPSSSNNSFKKDKIEQKPIDKSSALEEIQESQINTVENKQMSYGSETYKYSGPVNKDGNADGVGEGDYKAGTYKGSYVNGCRQGEGTFVTNDGSNTFRGTFRNDKYYEGTLTWEDGSYYIGTFKNGNLNNGKLYNKDDSFDSDVKNGQVN